MIGMQMFRCLVLGLVAASYLSGSAAVLKVPVPAERLCAFTGKYPPEDFGDLIHSFAYRACTGQDIVTSESASCAQIRSDVLVERQVNARGALVLHLVRMDNTSALTNLDLVVQDPLATLCVFVHSPDASCQIVETERLESGVRVRLSGFRTMATLLFAEGAPYVPSSEDCTADIQARIDTCSRTGGGEVRLGRGTYTVAGLMLKDGVTLHLDEGAILQAVTNRAAYPATPGWDRGAVVMCAAGAQNIGIVGKGVIDGRGDAMPLSSQPRAGRWRGVALYRAKNVRIEGVTIRRAHTWTCYLSECDGVVIRDVTIDSHVNINNDGLDIESSNVLVENCDIDSEDDALCLKAMTHATQVTNVVVRNCRISSNSSLAKIGTETRGIFRDIRVENCWLGVRTPIRVRDVYRVPGVTGRHVSIDGISVIAFDGAQVDGISFSNITMGAGIGIPFFIRIARSERYPGTVAGGSYLRNVWISDVTMTEPSVMRIPSVVAGINLKDGESVFRPQHIRFANVTLRVPADDPTVGVATKVPELAASYPAGHKFYDAERNETPGATAFYVRHADDVTFENVRILREPGARLRPDYIKEDVDVAR